VDKAVVIKFGHVFSVILGGSSGPQFHRSIVTTGDQQFEKAETVCCIPHS
jgi:hypothetical protein